MILLAGASGVLGTGYREALRWMGEAHIPMRLAWGNPHAVAQGVLEYWEAARTAQPEAPHSVVWAAGMGAVASGSDQILLETATIEAVVDALAKRVQPNPRNRFLFASSAGAIYGGHRTGLVAHEDPPAPITPYGHGKLAQERIVERLSADRVMGTLSCRFTNVYGMRSGVLPARGLVAAVIRAALEQHPARVFVNPDTRRDYVYARDAAALSVVEASTLPDYAGQVSIVGSGTTMTVMDVTTSVSRVLRRRVPVQFIESLESRVQPLALAFPPRDAGQCRIPLTAFDAAVRHMTTVPNVLAASPASRTARP